MHPSIQTGWYGQRLAWPVDVCADIISRLQCHPMTGSIAPPVLLQTVCNVSNKHAMLNHMDACAGANSHKRL